MSGRKALAITMAKAFEVDIEWEGVPGSRGRENRATWGRLRLAVNGEPITRVLDHRAKGYRDHILIPLYPVTEWIVTHWWPLLFEPESPGRKGYEQRHNLRLGRDGYAFPDLHLHPAGERVVLQWNPLAIDGGVTFPTQGSARIEREPLQEGLIEWVELVVARLEQQGIDDTLLREEWVAIQEADEDERAFCAASAQLGQDPYAVSEALAEAIVQAGSRLPPGWRDDFFSAAGVEQLPAQVDYALRSRDALLARRVKLGELTNLRGRAQKIDRNRAPWEQGYDVARWLRNERGVGIEPLATDTALGAILGLERLPFLEPRERQPGRWLDALVAMDEGGAGGFLATSRRLVNRRFAFCRALFEYLTDIETPSALITVARTERQKRNRAFAAELLAPSGWLRERYGDALVGPGDIEDVADELGVSGEVVRHQLENHAIARLVD
jgi:hypothetical protein